MTPRKPRPLTPEEYCDQLADTALAIIEDIRERDPNELFAHLTLGCQQDPHRMAQVIMALAAMVPADDTVKDINDRVWAISAARCTPLPGSAA